MLYKNRCDAGRNLAQMLKQLDLEDLTLLAIPRGGVIVAEPVADALNTDLGILVTRKIGHPLNPEVAIGAAMPDGSAMADEAVLEMLDITKEQFAEMTAIEYAEIRRRLREYTGTAELPDVRGRSVVVVDDGIATGYTIKAALRWLISLDPAKIVVAVPVAPPDVVADLRDMAAVLCPVQPDDFIAVGMYYEDFSQNTDEEVMAILRKKGGKL